MRAVLSAAMLVALLAIPASAAAPSSLTGDLDGDGADETITTAVDCASGGAPPCARQASVTISDTCSSGAPVQRKVATMGGSDPRVEGLNLVDADGFAGTEVLMDLRPNARLTTKENVRLVAWRTKSGEPCPAAKTLWSWQGPTGPPPYRGARYAGFEAAVAAVTTRYPGNEVILFEYFAGRGHPRTKPNLLRRTLFRFVDAKGVYVRYYRTVVRVKPS